jgi:bifunctional DNase/RNase
VGIAEAQSIAIALEHIEPPRPLTHDLLHSFLEIFKVSLLEVYIYKFEEGIFFSELLFEKEGQLSRLDSRTSDAIAMSLRTNCDIYASERVVRECGIVLEDPSLPEEEEEDDDEGFLYTLEPEYIKDEVLLKRWLSALDDRELRFRLNDSITQENYEYAKMYRDELSRREEKEEN